MKVSKNCSKRKIVLSSKLLSVIGMGEGTKVVVEALNIEGLRIRSAKIGDVNVRKISSRTYANRDGVEPVFVVVWNRVGASIIYKMLW